MIIIPIPVLRLTLTPLSSTSKRPDSIRDSQSDNASIASIEAREILSTVVRCFPVCAVSWRPMAARDGRWLMAAGLVLVRQRLGSAKGAIFMTVEDEAGVANVVVWSKLFERSRRVALGASMLSQLTLVVNTGINC